MPGKAIHNNTLKASFIWLCSVVFLMTSLVSGNLYWKHQQVIHHTLLQDLDLAVLTAETSGNVSQSKGSGNSAAVNQQSGLFAGLISPPKQARQKIQHKSSSTIAPARLTSGQAAVYPEIIPKDKVVNVVIEGVPFRVLVSVDPKTNKVTGIYSHLGKK